MGFVLWWPCLISRESIDGSVYIYTRRGIHKFEVTKVLELHAEWKHVGCLHVELHNEAAWHVALSFSSLKFWYPHCFINALIVNMLTNIIHCSIDHALSLKA